MKSLNNLSKKQLTLRISNFQLKYLKKMFQTKKTNIIYIWHFILYLKNNENTFFVSYF